MLLYWVIKYLEMVVKYYKYSEIREFDGFTISINPSNIFRLRT